MLSAKDPAQPFFKTIDLNVPELEEKLATYYTVIGIEVIPMAKPDDVVEYKNAMKELDDARKEFTRLKELRKQTDSTVKIQEVSDAQDRLETATDALRAVVLKL